MFNSSFLIFIFSNISIVLRLMMNLRLHCALVCVLVWIRFPVLFIHILPSVPVRPVESGLNVIYLPKSNERYITGSSGPKKCCTIHVSCNGRQPCDCLIIWHVGITDQSSLSTSLDITVSSTTSSQC